MNKKVVIEKIDFSFPSPYSEFTVNVFRNPSNAEYQHVKSKAVNNEIRGLLVGNVVYIWDGDLALHSDVIQLLDIDDDGVKRFIIDDRDEFINATMEPHDDGVPDHKMLQRMLRV